MVQAKENAEEFAKAPSVHKVGTGVRKREIGGSWSCEKDVYLVIAKREIHHETGQHTIRDSNVTNVTHSASENRCIIVFLNTRTNLLMGQLQGAATDWFLM